MHSDQRLDTEQLAQIRTRLQLVRTEVARVLVGQAGLVDRLLIGLLTGGHVLLEGVPGLAKTTAVKALAAATQASFRRIQFTPDLLPSDITGTLVYHPAESQYRTKLGPIFAQIVLADEINRAPAKVQSALLEAMQEHQVTLGETTHPLPQPFLVLATENPVEQEGTYPLPEAQVDRFMLKVQIDYPTAAEERLILDRMAVTQPDFPVRPVLAAQDILGLRQLVDRIHFADSLKDYVVRIVQATRGHGAPADLKGMIRMGASPRATINLVLAAKAAALLRGSSFANPDDIKAIAPDVLRHRISPSFDAESRGLDANAIVARILATVTTP